MKIRKESHTQSLIGSTQLHPFAVTIIWKFCIQFRLFLTFPNYILILLFAHPTLLISIVSHPSLTLHLPSPSLALPPPFLPLSLVECGCFVAISQPAPPPPPPPPSSSKDARYSTHNNRKFAPRPTVTPAVAWPTTVTLVPRVPLVPTVTLVPRVPLAYRTPWIQYSFAEFALTNRAHSHRRMRKEEQEEGGTVIEDRKRIP